MRLRLAMVLALMGLAAPAWGHEIRPGYLELRQTGAETFALAWKVPARGNARLAIRPRLPERCETTSALVSTTTDAAFVDRWEVTCAGGLAGSALFIEGLSGTLTDVLLRLDRSDGTAQVSRLTPASPSVVIQASPTWHEVASTYLGLGVDHILAGIDHLLFVLALLILVGGFRRLVATVTAFTVAHSLTLGAATLGLLRVPQQPVEAVVALSIVFVAAEIVRHARGVPSLTQQRPWAIAFVFGLLHGLGFAGALAEIGLPEQSIPTALLFFNLGVEAGQLLFVGVFLVLALLVRRAALPVPAPAAQVCAYGIGAVAAFWTIERVVGF